MTTHPNVHFLEYLHKAKPAGAPAFIAIEVERFPNAFENLSKQEQEMIVLACGLDDETPKTMMEASEISGLTEEMAQNIFEAAMRKLYDALLIKD